MVSYLAPAVPAYRGHCLWIGKDLHGLGDRLHPLDRHHDGNGPPLLCDRDGMIRSFLNHGGKMLLGHLDCVGVCHVFKCIPFFL